MEINSLASFDSLAQTNAIADEQEQELEFQQQTQLLSSVFSVLGQDPSNQSSQTSSFLK